MISSDDNSRHTIPQANFVLPPEPKSRNRLPPPPLETAPHRTDSTQNARHPGFRYDGRRTSGVWILTRHDFPSCPICSSSDDLTNEHLPMASLGGLVMTNTCKACNNKLGSNAEETLRAFVAGEVRFEAIATEVGEMKGRRRGTAAIRQAPFETPTLFVTSGDPDLIEAIASDVPLEVTYRLLDPIKFGIAVLKYAYLAATIWLRDIPISKQADLQRDTLIAARQDIPLSSDQIELVSRFTRNLTLVERPSHDSGSLAIVEPSVGCPDWTFILGGRLAIPWPFDDLSPEDRNQ